MGVFFPFSGSQWSSGLFGYQHCSRYLLLDSIERKSFLGELSLNGCNFQQQFNHSLVCHIVTKVMFTNFWLGTAYVFNRDEQRYVSFCQKRGDCSRVTEQCWGCVTIRSSTRMSHCCQWTVCSYTHKQSSVLQARPKHTLRQGPDSAQPACFYFGALFSLFVSPLFFFPPSSFLTTQKIWHFSRVCLSASAVW